MEAKLRVSRVTQLTEREVAAQRALCLVVIGPRGATRLIDGGETPFVRAVNDIGLGLPVDDRLVHHDARHVAHRGQLVHGIEQHRLEDGAQSARAGLSRHGAMRHRLERLVAELELGAFHLEEPPILLGEGVLGLGEDRDQRPLIELIERRDDRQAADELGDQAVLDQILGLDVVEQIAPVRPRVDPAHLGGEADAAALGAIEDDLLESRERSTADEEDVAGVDLQELLLRVLAAALRRDRGDRALDELEQRLLHALARYVTRDRGVVGLARDLVDLVDVDDAGLRLLDVVVALLQELLNDVLDVLAHVAGFREGRRIGDGERYVEEPRKGLRQERLAAARGADQQDIALGDLHIFLGARRAGTGLQTLVVVVDRDREHLLGAFLADHVLVEYFLDLVGLRQLVPGPLGAILELLANDVVAELDAFIADEYRGAGDELANLVLALPAEGAVQELPVVMTVARVFAHRVGLTSSATGRTAPARFVIAGAPPRRKVSGAR